MVDRPRIAHPAGVDRPLPELAHDIPCLVCGSKHSVFACPCLGDYVAEVHRSSMRVVPRIDGLQAEPERLADTGLPVEARDRYLGFPRCLPSPSPEPLRMGSLGPAWVRTVARGLRGLSPRFTPDEPSFGERFARLIDAIRGR